MASANEAGFNLREMHPPATQISCLGRRCGPANPDRADVCLRATPTTRVRVREGSWSKTPTGQRPGYKDGSRRGRSAERIGQEGRGGPPALPRPRSGAATSGRVDWLTAA